MKEINNIVILLSLSNNSSIIKLGDNGPILICFDGLYMHSWMTVDGIDEV